MDKKPKPAPKPAPKPPSGKPKVMIATNKTSTKKKPC